MVKKTTAAGSSGKYSRDNRDYYRNKDKAGSSSSYQYKKRKDGRDKRTFKKKSNRGGHKPDRKSEGGGSKDEKGDKGESCYDTAQAAAIPAAAPALVPAAAPAALPAAKAPSNFKYAWISGLFSLLSLSMIADVGLSVANAISASSKPIAGRIANCYGNWKCITNSRWILDIVKRGYKLQFTGPLPPTPHRVRNLPTDAAGTAVLDHEVEQMLVKSAIHAVPSSDDELTSCFFARPKKTPPGAPLKWRPIVSLKFLNKFLRYLKFKMTTIADVRLWIREGYFFTSLDLTDAYFSIPLHKSAWKYVRFVWRQVTYEFSVIMFGLAASPRVFTKVLKVVVKYLRLTFNMLIIAYLDDFLIQAEDYDTSVLHTELAVLAFQALGFEVNYAKSCMTPTTTIAHLGFIWNSVDMVLSLPQEKIDRIAGLAAGFIRNGGYTADELRSFLGRLESVRPVVQVAALHYRHLQYVLRPLRKGPWKGRKFLPLSLLTREELLWWKNVFPTPPYTVAPLRRGQCSVQIMADASGNYGWGGHSSRGQFCQGVWSVTDHQAHINRKEIMAGHRSIQDMMQQGDFVHLSLDNMTAVSFINRQGGTRSLPLCKEAISLWQTVLSRGGWVRASWVPREENQLSDLLSKSALLTWDFSLDRQIAERIWARWFRPVVDAFASQECHLVPAYYSWYPDPQATARDAFSVRVWPNRVFCFPPVPLIAMTLDKIRTDRITALIVVPAWRLALWWDILSEMMVGNIMTLPYYSTILSYPQHQSKRVPYLHPLVACLVSGDKTSLY